MQLLYYLWYLDEVLDIRKDGVLAYPKERTRERLSLTEERREAVEDTVRGVIRTVEQETPPPLEKKPFCDACLYQDICWL
jgi:CRISPR-associated exonuclease Cas4